VPSDSNLIPSSYPARGPEDVPPGLATSPRPVDLAAGRRPRLPISASGPGCASMPRDHRSYISSSAVSSATSVRRPGWSLGHPQVTPSRAVQPSAVSPAAIVALPRTLSVTEKVADAETENDSLAGDKTRLLRPAFKAAKRREESNAIRTRARRRSGRFCTARASVSVGRLVVTSVRPSRYMRPLCRQAYTCAWNHHDHPRRPPRPSTAMDSGRAYRESARRRRIRIDGRRPLSRVMLSAAAAPAAAVAAVVARWIQIVCDCAARACQRSDHRRRRA
jgi:hypothetical protein